MLEKRMFPVRLSLFYFIFIFFATASGHTALFHFSLSASSLLSTVWLQRIWRLTWKPRAGLCRAGLTWPLLFNKSHWNPKRDVAHLSVLNITQRWGEVERENVSAVQQIPVGCDALLTASITSAFRKGLVGGWGWWCWGSDMFYDSSLGKWTHWVYSQGSLFYVSTSLIFFQTPISPEQPNISRFTYATKQIRSLISEHSEFP